MITVKVEVLTPGYPVRKKRWTTNVRDVPVLQDYNMDWIGALVLLNPDCVSVKASVYVVRALACASL